MQEELQALQPTLKKTIVEVDELVVAVTREKEEVVEPQKAVVDVEVQQANAAAEHSKVSFPSHPLLLQSSVCRRMFELCAICVQRIRDECEAMLSEALPALKAAKTALNTIKPADIKLVQSFKSPPGAVKLVLEAVCVMMDIKPAMVADPAVPGKKVPDYWPAAKAMMNDSQFVEKLQTFDKDNMDLKIIEKVLRFACNSC